MDKKTRILWLDQLRAIAIFFVVLGHVALPAGAVKFIYSFHMPLFFIISGMTFRPDRYDSFFGRIKDKFKKLVVPHFLMNLLCLPLWIYTFKVLSSARPDLKELIKGIFYINSGKYQSPSNATWFLAALFLTDLLLYLVYKFAHGKTRYIVITVAIIGLAGFVESKNKSNYEGPWHIEAVLTAVVFLMLGYLFMRYYDRIMDTIKRTSTYVAVVICLLAVGVWCAMENGRVSMNGNTYDSLIYFYLGAVGISFALILLIMKLPRIGLLNYIGKNTIAYVGIHIPIIRVIQKLFPIVDSRALYAFLLAVFVYLIMVPIVCVINNFFPYIISKPWNLKSKPDKIAKISVTVIGIIVWGVSMVILIPRIL